MICLQLIKYIWPWFDIHIYAHVVNIKALKQKISQTFDKLWKFYLRLSIHNNYSCLAKQETQVTQRIIKQISSFETYFMAHMRNEREQQHKQARPMKPQPDEQPCIKRSKHPSVSLLSLWYTKMINKPSNH